MIQRSQLAVRTFMRRFQTAIGYTPVEYVQTLRIEEAEHLRETSDRGIEEVGWLIGYEGPTLFRRLFRRRKGVTPVRYRQ